MHFDPWAQPCIDFFMWQHTCVCSQQLVVGRTQACFQQRTCVYARSSTWSAQPFLPLNAGRSRELTQTETLMRALAETATTSRPNLGNL